MNPRKWLIEQWYAYLFGDLEYETVLEVGSGHGKMVDYFTKIGKKMDGTDLYPTRGDIRKLDFLTNKIKDNSYDLVYTAHVLEHMKDPEFFVSELIRVSKRYVCVVTPLPGKRFWDQPDHIRPYTAETLRRIFHTQKPVRSGEMNFPGFEPISYIVYEKKQPHLSKKEK